MVYFFWSLGFFALCFLELLEFCEKSSREYSKIKADIEHSFWNTKCGIQINKIEIVNNEELNAEVTFDCDSFRVNGNYLINFVPVLQLCFFYQRIFVDGTHFFVQNEIISFVQW